MDDNMSNDGLHPVKETNSEESGEPAKLVHSIRHNMMAEPYGQKRKTAGTENSAIKGASTEAGSSLKQDDYMVQHMKLTQKTVNAFVI